MTIRTILPTRDPSSGWAASERNGYDVQSVWAMAGDALGTIFALAPIEVRDFLDSHAGRLLADDIGFIEDGPTSAEAIETLIKTRLGHLGWQRLYEETISEIARRHALQSTLAVSVRTPTADRCALPTAQINGGAILVLCPARSLR